MLPQGILDPQRALLVHVLTSMHKRHCYYLVVLINSCLAQQVTQAFHIYENEISKGGGGQCPLPPPK